MTPEHCAEDIRSALQVILPSYPGEKIRDWLDRVSRSIKREVPSARLLAYWHRRVARPEMHEGIIILGAANHALARQRAIEEQGAAISRRALELAQQHASLHPILRLLAPRPLGPPAPQEAEDQVVRSSAASPAAEGEALPRTPQLAGSASVNPADFSGDGE